MLSEWHRRFYFVRLYFIYLLLYIIDIKHNVCGEGNDVGKIGRGTGKILLENVYFCTSKTTTTKPNFEMKKILFMAAMVATLMLTIGCGKTIHTYLPDSQWQQVDEDGYDLRATLTFVDRTVAVQGSTTHTYPLFDDLFDYYLNPEGDEMTIYYYEMEYVGDSWTETRVDLDFDLEFRNAEREMILTYYNLFGKDIVLRFVKK